MKKEEQLFNEWKNAVQSEYTNFITDGIVCEDEWNSSDNNMKIMFVLKEVNGGEANRSLAKCLFEGASDKEYCATWSNIARWTYAIHNIDNPENQRWANVKQRGNYCGRRKHLKTICAINIKKSPGGASTKKASLEAFYNYKSPVSGDYVNRDYLRKQVELYFNEADIIVCCGKAIVFNIFINLIPDCNKKIVNNSNFPRYIIVEYNDRKKLIVDYYHPQVRAKGLTNQKMCEDLIRIVKQYVQIRQEDSSRGPF